MWCFLSNGNLRKYSIFGICLVLLHVWGFQRVERPSLLAKVRAEGEHKEFKNHGATKFTEKGYAF